MYRHSTTLVTLIVGAALQFSGFIAQAGPVNVNTADAETLSRELKGIGMKRAEAIVEYRKKFGPFKSADELALVKGIGPSAIQKNREFVRIDAKAAVAAAKPAAKPVAEAQRPSPAKR
ncbi:MAG TPA: helix-hairpin-helix domain-containing protein [Steroidobacteraceae bacterium]|nr:helix-hairpin-helix domain-containing protein [Steroidobacteraceae bacterium]